MRALTHIGLAALIVLAPTLCCCNLHYLTGRASAASSCPSCVASPTSVPETPTCCQQHATSKKKACCEEAVSPTDSKLVPQTNSHSQCKCASERSDTAPPLVTPEVAAPEATGELLPVLLHLQTAIPLEHLGLLGGLDPPERAGVDTLSEALFSRHVMRC